jgi:hypothetical protein
MCDSSRLTPSACSTHKKLGMLHLSVLFPSITNYNFNVCISLKFFMTFGTNLYIINVQSTSLMTHLCVWVHEHLGKNICYSLQFWSCESISILKVILQAHQSFFAVYPVCASTVCNDVTDVLNIQQCYGPSSLTSKWHHSISQQLTHSKQAHYTTKASLQLTEGLMLNGIRWLYWQLQPYPHYKHPFSCLSKNHKPGTSLKTKYSETRLRKTRLRKFSA